MEKERWNQQKQLVKQGLDQGLPVPSEDVILRRVKSKANQWTNVAHYNRKHL